MLGLGMIFLIALGLIAAKGGKGTASPMTPSSPSSIPGFESMPLDLRQRIADALKALTVGDDGKIAGPVTAEAIRTATALAAELEKLGYKDAGASLRAYAKAAASLLPAPKPAQQIPLPPSIPAALAAKLQKALQTERDPKVLEGIKAALQKLPPSPEVAHAIELIDNMILQLKIAAENQAAASAIQKVITPPGSDPMSLPTAPLPPSVAIVKYRVQPGDTGEKVAQKFVGDKARWRDLLVTNPNLKSAQYGIALYAGKDIVIPTSLGWPATPTGAMAPPVPPPPPVPSSPTPQAPSSTGPATYKVVRGDTGEKVAFKFVGDKSRWRELLTVNPTLKDATYGIRLYEGKIIKLPASWPAVPGQVAPASPLPSAPPSVFPATVTPSAPMSPVESAADAMVKNLRAVQNNFGMPGAKGKEDFVLAKRFQNLSGQSTPDGKAGPGTLGMAAQFQSDLPLVMYWPKSANAAKVLEYRKVLEQWAAKADAAGDTLRAANLRASAARERGQAGIVGPMPA